MQYIKRLAALGLVLCMALGIFGCGTSSDSQPAPLNTEFPGQSVDFTFAPTPSDKLTLSAEGGAAVLETVNAQQAQYTYAHLYHMDEVKTRLQFDASVENHQYSALNPQGKLDGGHLVTLVKANNTAYLAEHTFGYKEVEEDYLREICNFIVLVTENMRDQYPDIDWDRVLCNLGNLKILYNTGMLSFAQVSNDMVLSISKNNTQIVLNLKGRNSFSQVLVHELMHVVQLGCACETIENCDRRAGIAIYWDDFESNTADWTWLVEGSAERHMCKLTGGPAVSYQYKMDYICSFTMSLLLRSDVQADTMENLCFQDDPQLLFDAFGCQSEEERDEVLRLMITMNILQMQPDSFYREYEKTYGVNPKNDDAAMDQISYGLKPAVCITLAKEFYVNLVAYLQNNQMPANDLFCLLRLFEGHINQHLGYHVASRAQINAPFLAAYREMRNALFAVLSQETGMDVAAMFDAYEISHGENTINGEFAALPETKRTFLLERAQWQSEQNALGTKVPNS